MMKTATQTTETLPFILTLTLSGGYMDGYSYLCRDKVFANAQTGNMLLLGVNLSAGNFAAALRYLVPILAFAMGIGATQVLRHRREAGGRSRWQQQVLLAEAAILLAAAFFPQSLNLIANSLISLACGAQVQAFQRAGGRSIATTMCIGNLRAGTQALCDYRLTGEPQAREGAKLYFGVIFTFVVGAVLSRYAIALWREGAIVGSSLLLLAAAFYLHKNED